MNAISSRETARELVQAFGTIGSTEDLIIFVAGRSDMLSFCQALLEEYDNQQGPLVQEIDALCAARGVLAGSLYAELRKVLLALNRYHDEQGDHYAALGLDPAASDDEVKKAFRRLSKQYHPDTGNDSEESVRRFMEITGAYHAIMDTRHGMKSRDKSPWRTKRNQLHPFGRRRDAKKFFSIMLFLLAILTGISLYISTLHRQEALLRQIALLDPPPAPQIRPDDSGKADAEAEHPSPSPAPGAMIRPDIREEDKPEPPQSISSTARFPADADDSSSGPGKIHPAVIDFPTTTGGEIRTASVPRTPEKNDALSVTDEETSVSQQTGAQLAVQMTTPERAVDQSSTRKQEPDVTVHLQAAPEPPAILTPAATRHPQHTFFSGTIPAAGSLPLSEANPPPLEAEHTGIHNDAAAINGLISRYVLLYTQQSLIPYLSLFTENATENDHPVAGLASQYMHLFSRTKDIDLSIFNIDWQNRGGAYEARGDFEVSYAYNEGSEGNYRGKITFHLVKQGGQLKISSLDYVFSQ